MRLSADLICGATAHACVCALPPGHDGPHVCGNDNGSWLGEWATPTFEIVRYPEISDGDL